MEKRPVGRPRIENKPPVSIYKLRVQTVLYDKVKVTAKSKNMSVNGYILSLLEADQKMVAHIHLSRSKQTS